MTAVGTNPNIFADARIFAVVAVFALLYGSRLNKGKARETPAGVVFPMKPMVIVARVAALVLYIGFFGYTLRTQGTAIPMWFPALFLLAVGFILLQLPGTIVLGPESITQNFWFLKQRVIRYGEVMAIQAFSAGRAIRVLGDNRMVVTHTNNHSDAQRFRAELERSTGKRIG